MKEHIIRTEILSLKQCRAYVKKNSKRIGKTDFWKVVNPLKVWKKTGPKRGGGRVITALLIPEGATIFMQTEDGVDYTDSRKMRASEAFIQKQFYVGWPSWQDRIGNVNTYEIEHYDEVSTSRSVHSPSFQYKTGETVKPEYGFSTYPAQCDSGIHFFVNLRDALAY